MKVRDVDVVRLSERLDNAIEAAVENDADFDGAGRLQRLLEEAEITNEDLAVMLRITPNAVINKLAGRRLWHLRDVEPVLTLLSARLGRKVTFEDTFCYTIGAASGRLQGRGRRRKRSE